MKMIETFQWWSDSTGPLGETHLVQLWCRSYCRTKRLYCNIDSSHVIDQAGYVIWALCRGASCPLTLQPSGMAPPACWADVTSSSRFSCSVTACYPPPFPPHKYTPYQQHTLLQVHTSLLLCFLDGPPVAAPPLISTPTIPHNLWWQS